MIVTTVTVRQKGDINKKLDDIIKQLEGPKRVKVGLPAGKAPGDVIDIGFWNHEGTNRKKGDVFFSHGQFGISGPIPRRPFITVAMFRGRSQIRAAIRSVAKAAISGKTPLKTGLEKVGMLGADLIRKTIDGGGFAPNSGMTVKLKGSSKPLVDTGRLRASVTHEVVP
jgi:hypothetical protein